MCKYLREMKACIHGNAYTPVLTGILYVTAHSWWQPKVTSAGEGIKH